MCKGTEVVRFGAGVVFILVLVLLVSACARRYVLLDQVLIRNATTGKITEVMVRHEPTQKFAEVNAILPGKSLEMGLSGGGQPMRATQAVVKWRDAEGREWSVNLDLPHDRQRMVDQQPVNLVYVIAPAGQVSVGLQKSAH